MEGDTMVEDRGEMSVKEEMTNVAIHFLRLGQFLGFLGSEGESHVTLGIR